MYVLFCISFLILSINIDFYGYFSPYVYTTHSLCTWMLYPSTSLTIQCTTAICPVTGNVLPLTLHIRFGFELIKIPIKMLRWVSGWNWCYGLNSPVFLHFTAVYVAVRCWFYYMNVELEFVVKRVNICICCVLNAFASCMLFVLHFNALI